jgi:hypothetical protein
VPQPTDDEPAVSEPEDDDVPQPEPEGAAAPSSTNPFGVPAGTSPTPGVITPVPQPRTLQRPRIQDPD